MRWFSDCASFKNQNSTQFNLIERYKSKPTWRTNGNFDSVNVNTNSVSPLTLVDLGADLGSAYVLFDFCTNGRTTFELIFRDNALNDLAVFEISIGFRNQKSFWFNPDSSSTVWRYMVFDAYQMGGTSVLSGYILVGDRLLLPI